MKGVILFILVCISCASSSLVNYETDRLYVYVGQLKPGETLDIQFDHKPPLPYYLIGGIAYRCPPDAECRMFPAAVYREMLEAMWNKWLTTHKRRPRDPSLPAPGPANTVRPIRCITVAELEHELSKTKLVEGQTADMPAFNVCGAVIRVHKIK